MTDAIRLLTVDCVVGTPGAEQCTFRSAHTILGYDLVIFDPLAAHSNLVGAPARSARLQMGNYDPLLDIFSRRAKEFQMLFDLGKMVVCLIPPPTSVTNFNRSKSVV